MKTRNWLFLAALFTEAVGILMVVGALIPGFYDPLLGLLFGSGTSAGAAARLGFGIAGAVMAGWAVTIALLARSLEALSTELVGTAVASGVATWFVLDAVVSVGTGASLNVVGNLVFLAVLLPPALALRAHGLPRQAA